MQKKTDFIYKYISCATAYNTKPFHVALKFYPQKCITNKNMATQKCHKRDIRHNNILIFKLKIKSFYFTTEKKKSKVKQRL